MITRVKPTLPLVRRSHRRHGTGCSGWSYAVALDDDDGGSAAGAETAGASASRSKEKASVRSKEKAVIVPTIALSSATGVLQASKIILTLRNLFSQEHSYL